MTTLKEYVKEIIQHRLTPGAFEPPLDYFSWGRDNRHKELNTEKLPESPVAQVAPQQNSSKCNSGVAIAISNCDDLLAVFDEKYAAFNATFNLMSDEYSRNLFAELIVLKLTSEKDLRLTSFTQSFVDSYETASSTILAADQKYPIYGRTLRRVDLTTPAVSFYTVPTVLNLHLTGKLYRYEHGNTTVEVEAGDIIIDAGVGWGDTTVYLASIAHQGHGGYSYAFDILKDGLAALDVQIKTNPNLANITPVLKALSDSTGQDVYITEPSPGARVVDKPTENSVKTITIDDFVAEQAIANVHFIKMDIEGAEVPALKGATQTIRQHKPKLAISVYHKWDDLLKIPALINNIRNDYEFYLECTTGFGGETVMYCK